ncbi:aromatic ring-hydroxylating oxygenase subunit alpha [Streptomyces sp. AN091965]|uniref:aromatic ring-hydroxylating oxygenase subunit alpha n=1 Tax=Streptomyces sp. AN091965 TaxID=2927803 RepID=UPI001F60CBF8|nr:aromatic ring-hydroxylating dioxygenase subunit alpha [Streptomyces sp. AN091965]MCI3934224.1 aromatic ring-hydroxylating dioxygenase subunit alpha [Streptomyces sp. AN091965]
MIPNQWYPILRTEDVKRDAPTGVKRLGEELVLWRDLSGKLVCQSARCPHKGANLSGGRVVGNSLACPYHGFRYDAGGACRLIPALGTEGRIPASLRIDTYEVREQHGLVWLWWGEQREELPDIELPHELAEHPRPYRTITWSRPVHYTRYIESLLEFYHVTFVHRDHWANIIDYTFMYGSWRKLWTDGRERYIAANKIVNHRVDVDGTTIRSTFDQCEEGNPSNIWHFDLIYQAPCMTHVRQGLLEVTTWLTPIDEENTQAIMRLWEYPLLKRMVPVKALRTLILKASLQMEKHVQDQQDNAIMARQEPKVSERGVNKLIAPDEMNAKYLQMRDRLKAEARADAEARAAERAREAAAGDATAPAPADSGNGASPANGSSPANGTSATNAASAANGTSPGQAPAAARPGKAAARAGGVSESAP